MNRQNCLLAFLALAALFCVRPQISAADEQNWGRGPIELEDQFPLALLHSTFIPTSPRVLDQGQCRARSSFGWTNTINQRRGSYLVDSEVRYATVGLSCSPVERLEVGLEQPLVWRGGGVLDHLIYEWHELFGLPQGPRDHNPDNRYEISGRSDEGEEFNLQKKGTALSDLTLRTKYLISPGNQSAPAWSLVGSLRFPTGEDQYGQDSVDVTAGLLSSKRWGSLSLYGGVGYIFLGDPTTENFEFARNRGTAFSYIEYELIEELSLLAGLHWTTALTTEVPKFPDYELYLDIGAKIEFVRTWVLELLVRENPGAGKGTADVTFFAGLSKEF